MADDRAIQQFQTFRNSFAQPDYTAVQEIYWNRSRNEKRGAPTPVGSGLTTPHEDADMGDASATAAASAQARQDADPPSLVQPFTIVLQTRKEPQWLSQDHRLAQKHQAALQVLTSGWPNHMNQRPGFSCCLGCFQRPRRL